MLRIQGHWFHDLGFNVGDSVLVKCEEGKLIIMADTTMAELKKAEQAFMEEETRKLQARFQKEKLPSTNGYRFMGFVSHWTLQSLFLCPFACRTFSNGQKMSQCYAPDNYRKAQKNEVQK